MVLLNFFRDHRLASVALLAALLVAVWTIYLAVRICRFDASPRFGSADAAVVLGGAVDRHGRPTPAFEQRIRHAANLYRTGKVRRLVFTGGPDAPAQTPEAVGGRRFAIGLGVPEKDTLLEDRSGNTWENLLHAKPILENNNLHRVALVSDRLHLRRACHIAERLGLEAVPSATPTGRFESGWPWLWFLGRETIAWAVYTIQRPFLQADRPADR